MGAARKSVNSASVSLNCPTDRGSRSSSFRNSPATKKVRLPGMMGPPRVPEARLYPKSSNDSDVRPSSEPKKLDEPDFVVMLMIPDIASP